MPMFYVKRWKKAKDVLDKMKPKFIKSGCSQRTSEDKLEKYGKTGKPLLNMPLISRTLPVMHGLPINSLFKSHYPAEYMAGIVK
jgi:hypothetical protein